MKPRHLACLVTLLLPLAACNTGVTDPIDEPLTFQGTIEPLGRVRHDVVFTHDGIVRVLMTSVEIRLAADNTLVNRALLLGLDLGEPGDDVCNRTFRGNIFEGAFFTFGLQEGTHCLEIFDGGGAQGLQEGEIGVYTLTVTPTE